jgi:hypothetical protein
MYFNPKGKDTNFMNPDDQGMGPSHQSKIPGTKFLFAHLTPRRLVIPHLG